MQTDTLIYLKHIEKFFLTDQNKKQKVLKDVNLAIRKKSIFGIIGYSGAGKSTLIRCINGIEKPNSGKVFFNKNVVNETKGKKLRKLQQKMGMIFQQFNLMPSRTVFDNVFLAIKYHHIKRKKAKKRVLHLLQLVGLPQKTRFYPSQLSGGQKQRVAIARALANQPTVLLCDEATSALDPQTTQDILRLLHQLNLKLGITLIMVTHEMSVIEQMCDFVAVLDHGTIIEKGNVYSVFSNPKFPLTKKFINTTSRLEIPDNILKTNLLNISPPQKLVKITYQKSKTMTPLISEISRKFNINANIITGDIKILQKNL